MSSILRLIKIFRARYCCQTPEGIRKATRCAKGHRQILASDADEPPPMYSREAAIQRMSAGAALQQDRQVPNWNRKVLLSVPAVPTVPESVDGSTDGGSDPPRTPPAHDHPVLREKE